MTLEKQMYPWALVFFLSGCTLLPAEKSDSVTNTDPIVESDVTSVVEIKFVESAPKDRFVITNRGACALEELTLELDLSPSTGRLIFDTTATGAGVEVFQPFEVEAGDIVQLVADGVNDGDTKLALRITSLGPGDGASFTIDVDDTLPSSDLGQIRIADSEISGATVSITSGDSDGDSETIVTKFDNGSVARAQLPACPSAQ